MKSNVLVAEPRDILRTKLRTIFASDERVARVYEAATKTEFQMFVCNKRLDIVVANQTLITDIAAFPQGRFIILAAELDVHVFQTIYKSGAIGYLLENTSEDLLREALNLPSEAFLIEPIMATQIIEYLLSDPRFMVKEELLTPREREIMALLRKGINRPAIAKKLSISEATLKTHIKNIAQKRKHASNFPLSENRYHQLTS